MSKSKIGASREIWAADSETDPFAPGRIPAPFIWGAYSVIDGITHYHQFRTTEAFVEFIRERDCIVYAHNGGKFDWHFLLHLLTPWQPVMIIAGRFAKFKIGKAEFRDSYNIMPMALSVYKKDDIDYKLFEADVRENHMPEIEKYLRSDCEYLYEMLMAFIDEFGLHLTQAGASIKAWEKITEVKAPVTSPEFYAEMSPFYYGGRVQCFHSGEYKKQFKIIDINSAYPRAMMDWHPYGDTISCGTKLPKGDDELSRSFITLTAQSMGAFPFRTIKGLEFPADKEVRQFTITGWEYIAARDTGTLLNARIIEVRTFTEKIEFSVYLNHFSKMKTDAKHNGYDDKRGWFDSGLKARYEFAKRFLNSLYGKFGSNPENYEEFTVVEMAHIEAAEQEGGYLFVMPIGKRALVARDLIESRRRYYNVAVAASITGWVRAYLWRAISTCKAAGGKVLYCDTDCVWTTNSGDLYLHPEELGAWDVEAECDYGAIAGKKMYAARPVGSVAKPPDLEKNRDLGKLKWKTASKGVRLGADEIVRIAKDEIITHIPENPSFSAKRGIKFIQRTISASAADNLNEDELDHGN